MLNYKLSSNLEDNTACNGNLQFMERLLVIEDNDAIAEEVEAVLQDIGFAIDRAANGRAGLQMAQSEEYALIVLDLMLPGLGGTEIVQELRQGGNAVPILMLSAKDDELSKVLLLESGADDYLSKPFSASELKARVKAILRRTAKETSDVSGGALFELGDLRIDFERKIVSVAGKVIALTPTEFGILEVLAERPGSPVARDVLRDKLFGVPCSGFESSVSSHVSRLRRKIENNPELPQYVVTVRGFGYALGEPSASFGKSQ